MQSKVQSRKWDGSRMGRPEEALVAVPLILTWEAALFFPLPLPLLLLSPRPLRLPRPRPRTAGSAADGSSNIPAPANMQSFSSDIHQSKVII